MNCQDAESQIFAARDTPLGAADAAVLKQHLQECTHCRRLAENLESAAAAWRQKDQSVTPPDAQQEWHAVRRRIRSGEGAPLASTGLPSWGRLLRLAVPLAAAFAVAIGISTRSIHQPISLPTTTIASVDWSHFDDHFNNYARVEYIETDNIDVSPYVYVDEESGWLIVWASDAPDQPSS